MAGPILEALGIGGLIKDTVGKVIDRVVVDKNQAELMKLEASKMELGADIQSMLSQLEINKIEAQSDKWWKSGARPFMMWMGGLGFGVQFVFVPLVGYIYSLIGYAAPPPIVLDPTLYTVVFGLLGLGYGARTFEKVKGVA